MFKVSSLHTTYNKILELFYSIFIKSAYTQHTAFSVTFSWIVLSASTFYVTIQKSISAEVKNVVLTSNHPNTNNQANKYKDLLTKKNKCSHKTMHTNFRRRLSSNKYMTQYTTRALHKQQRLEMSAILSICFKYISWKLSLQGPYSCCSNKSYIDWTIFLSANIMPLHQRLWIVVLYKCHSTTFWGKNLHILKIPCNGKAQDLIYANGIHLLLNE